MFMMPFQTNLFLPQRLVKAISLLIMLNWGIGGVLNLMFLISLRVCLIWEEREGSEGRKGGFRLGKLQSYIFDMIDVLLFGSQLGAGRGGYKK